ncbi:MAG: hypothetical protein KDB80_03175, partial [Planctomycetes bacterium]|nr:hypothetical protein [Planctomycetota bacterium]
MLPILAMPALGQRDKRPPKKPDEEEEKWREDPYTENEKSAIEAAGYVFLDRITWTEQIGSDR